MAWQTPKTNWSAADGVRDSDFNRIEGNILELYNTGGVTADRTIYVSTSGNDSTGTGASSLPFRTLTKALSVIPKNTNGYNVTINIGDGVYAENVVIKGFTGVLRFDSSSSSNTAVINSLTIDGCNVRISRLRLSLYAGLQLTNGAVFYSDSNIACDTGAPNGDGVNIDQNSRCAVYGVITVNSTSNNAVHALYGGYFYALHITGSGNSTGLCAENGGLITYDSEDIGTLTKYYTATGGRIYSGAQTSMPKY